MLPIDPEMHYQNDSIHSRKYTVFKINQQHLLIKHVILL